jgi:hypothetical protein
MKSCPYDIILAIVLFAGGLIPAHAQEPELGQIDSKQSKPKPSEQYVTTGAGTVTLVFSCAENHLLAVTNRVPTTIKSPFNAGDCTFILECGRGISFNAGFVGLRAQFPAGTAAHSFSCGADARSIFLSVGGGQHRQASLSTSPNGRK